jgi:hypothetical protein
MRFAVGFYCIKKQKVIQKGQEEDGSKFEDGTD